MNVGIIGTGAWGRALATLVAEAGHQPRIGYRRRSPRGFPGTPNLAMLAEDSDLLIVAVPAGAVREVVEKARPGPGSRVVIATRGIEPESGRWLSSVVLAHAAARRVGALAGPALASEVVERRPGALVVASPYEEVRRLAQAALHSSICRVYTSEDLRGVELAGAAVNVLSAVVGMADALRLGVGVRGVIVTRGLAEIARLGDALGADPATFAGLAGMGDLVGCGCHPDHPSYQAGGHLARAESGDPELARKAEALLSLAARHEVELPLLGAMARIARGELKPRLAIDMLMRRSAKSERR